MQDDPNQRYTQAELLQDRLRHAVVFTEATLRVLQEMLALLEPDTGTTR